MNWMQPDPEAMARFAELVAQGYNQNQMIEMFWGVKRGASHRWQDAREQYQQLITFVPSPAARQAEMKSDETELTQSLITSQYEALRSEINQRLDLHQQILIYTLIVAGTLFGLGLQSWMSGCTILCYPILAYFLAGAWSQHDLRIGQIAKFLRMLEDRYLDRDGWESYRRRSFQKKHPLSSGLIELPTRGIFLVSQVLAVVLGVARSLPIPMDQHAMLALFGLLLVIDAVAIMMTVLTLRHRRERGPGQPASPSLSSFEQG